MMLFNGQRPSETVRLIAHQPPVVLFVPLLIAGAFLALGVAAFAFLTNGLLMSVLLIICPLIAIAQVLVARYRWKNTVVLVSTERVAFFYQKGLFRREFYECPVQTIVQVAHRVEGPVQTLCGFGTVIINTGDAQSSIVMKNLPDPFDIQQEIQNVLAGG